MRGKHIISIIVSITVIATTIILPPYLMDRQKEYLIGKKTIEEVDAKPKLKQTPLTVMEKLSIINGYKKSGATMRIEQRTYENGKTLLKSDELETICIEQLNHLRDAGIIHVIEYGHLEVLDILTATYIDRVTTTNSVVVWEVTLQSKEYKIQLTVDDISQKIYNLEINSLRSSVDSDNVQTESVEIKIDGNMWGKYLNISTSGVSKDYSHIVNYKEGDLNCNYEIIYSYNEISILLK